MLAKIFLHGHNQLTHAASASARSPVWPHLSSETRSSTATPMLMDRQLVHASVGHRPHPIGRTICDLPLGLAPTCLDSEDEAHCKASSSEDSRGRTRYHNMQLYHEQLHLDARFVRMPLLCKPTSLCALPHGCAFYQWPRCTPLDAWNILARPLRNVPRDSLHACETLEFKHHTGARA